MERAVTHFGLEKENAPAILKKKDKARSNHYKYYTDQEWGMASNYDLSLNSSTLGVEGSVEFLSSYIDKRISKMK